MNKEDGRWLGGIQRFSTEDGPGIRTTLFFKGCPLNCKWCHNPELISKEYEILYSPKRCISCGMCAKICPQKAVSMAKEDGVAIDREKCVHCGKCASVCCSEALRAAGEQREMGELIHLLCRDRDFYDNTDGGVTLSGGEVLFQPRYACEVMRECMKNGLKVAIDTCGFGEREDIMEICKDAQTVLFDIKTMYDEKHRELTGVGTDVIHANLRALAAEGGIAHKIIIRMPLIHDVNDQVDDLELTCKFMKELGLKKVNLLPYHGMGTSKTRSMGGVADEFETPSDEHLDRARKLFRSYDLDVMIMGQDDEKDVPAR